MIALDEALGELGHDSRGVQVVLLKYVAGLNTQEIASALEVSPRTVEREWRFARSFLYTQLAADRSARSRPE